MTSYQPFCPPCLPGPWPSPPLRHCPPAAAKPISLTAGAGRRRSTGSRTISTASRPCRASSPRSARRATCLARRVLHLEARQDALRICPAQSLPHRRPTARWLTIKNRDQGKGRPVPPLADAAPAGAVQQGRPPARKPRFSISRIRTASPPSPWKTRTDTLGGKLTLVYRPDPQRAAAVGRHRRQGPPHHRLAGERRVRREDRPQALRGQDQPQGRQGQQVLVTLPRLLRPAWPLS